MTKDLGNLDWSLVQSFLAVADTGSLSAAADRLGHSQPTLGRHIKAIEAQIGASLFQRHPRGLHLTELGTEVLPAAQDMARAMTQIALAAEAKAGEVAGTVRIACSVFAAHHVLPHVLASIRAAEPQIDLVIRPSDDTDNLLFREADIAVRMYRPDQLSLITRHIADIDIGVFASRTYLAQRGTPLVLEDLLEHDLVGYDENPVMLNTIRALGYDTRAEDFAVRTDNQSAYWEFVRAGCGIGFIQAHLGRSDPQVEELHLDIQIPSLPVWLTTTEQARRVPRIARVWQILARRIPFVLSGDIDPAAPQR